MKRILLCSFFTILFMIIVSLGLSSCLVIHTSGNRVSSSSLRGSGDREIFEFQVDEFKGLNVPGNMEIHYYALSSDIVSLEIQPNLVDYYIVEVKDAVLTVRPIRGVNVSSGFRPVLSVSTPVLESLSLSGSCTFTAHDRISGDSFSLRLSGSGRSRAELDVERLDVRISGSGNVEFSGRADTVDFNISGSGNLNALELQSREAAIRISGSGRVGISCSESLNIRTSGSGTVSYRGSPRVNINNSGSARVINVD